MKIINPLFLCLTFLFSCQANKEEKVVEKAIQFITLDPGHFHAALVQKSMYDNVDSTVYVYAPEGDDLDLHLNRIESYNARENSPTRWNEVIYQGDDFFEKLIDEKAGNVVVLSGNNQKKTEYILKTLENGMHVLADKPMVIDSKGFETLKKAFSVARENDLMLYDVMTERFEITTILQKELSQIPEIFGELEKGTMADPAITKESVHYLFKYVSGSVLTRPAWFLDISQQGEGIVDVMTHLVDLVQWECFPAQVIDYENEIGINEARHWTTDINLEEFKAITKMDQFPDFLLKNVNEDSILQIYCNGEINYTVKGVHAKTSVTWGYKAPEGTGDTHYSIMRGTKSNLIIRQGEEENFKPSLYIEPVLSDAQYEEGLTQNFSLLESKFPGIGLIEKDGIWKVEIPDKYKVGHEEHFAQVTANFLEYLQNGSIPEWEVPNMIAKYYTTTRALEMVMEE